MLEYTVFTSGYGGMALQGLYSISVNKSMFAEQERKEADGQTYSETRKGICTLQFIENLSEFVKVGDYIVIIRNMTAISGSGAFIGRNENTRVVFQGVVVHAGWSQFVDKGHNFKTTFNVRAHDLTQLLTDTNFLPKKFVETSGKYNSPDIYHKAINRVYGIDCSKGKKYQRGVIVDKLFKNYVKNRLEDGFGEQFDRAKQIVVPYFIPGFTYNGTAGAYDYVSSSEIFKTMSFDQSVWRYLSLMTSDPLYEMFVRENTGEFVFRRSEWNKPMKNALNVTDALTWASRISDFTYDNQNYGNRARFWKLYDYNIGAIHIDHNFEGIPNIVKMGAGTSSLPAVGVDSGNLQRYGIKYSAKTDYPPMFELNSFGFNDNLQATIYRLLNFDLLGALQTQVAAGDYQPEKIQEELLLRGLANQFRGTIQLLGWHDISIGDHVQIDTTNSWDTAITVLRNIRREFVQLLQDVASILPGIKGSTHRVEVTEDMIFYVTGKELKVTIADNGQFTETFRLTLNFGGLEFTRGAGKYKLVDY